jgi:hypothetical protein
VFAIGTINAGELRRDCGELPIEARDLH